MSILRRILRIEQPEFNDQPVEDIGLTIRAMESEAELLSRSQELRQAVQRVESSARVFNTWNGAMRMLRDGE